MTATIELHKGPLSLGVEPALGGCVSFFRVSDQDVFRKLPHKAGMSALNSGSFPLVPFSNRIKNGAFEFDGKKYNLACNFGNEENAIHGNGWQSEWNVSSVTEDECELELVNNCEWWPWSFIAKLKYRLGENVLEMTLSIENTDDVSMPVGLGFHPYFCANEDTEVQFDAMKAYLPFQNANAENIPSSNGSHLDFSVSRKVKTTQLIDHNYDGWGGVAHIKNCGNNLDLVVRASSSMRRAMVYSPVGETYFCFEPTTHSAGAYNSDNFEENGLKILAPNTSMSASCFIELC